MKYQELKTIPELRDKVPDERAKLVKDAYALDRGLTVLNLIGSLAIAGCFPISIVLTEWVIGYRSLLRSVPLYLLLACFVGFLVKRCFINPRIAKVLRNF